MRVVLLGPPGAGKGTQAARIAAEYGTPHIATGDIFRQHVREETELGVQARQYIDAGELVPDEIVNNMVAERLERRDCEGGFVLDGYPRTVAQAEELERHLERRGCPLQAVLSFEISEEELVARLRHRAAVEGRTDDSAAVVAHRLAVYRRRTAPLVDFYATRGLLTSVDAVGEVEEVTQRAMKAIASR